MELLRLSGIVKSFSSNAVRALDGADFDLKSGEVHALVGENGAGKSTLAKVACGLLIPDAGTIAVRGSAAAFKSHRDAERAGIGLVPQYSMLAPGLTVAENLALGHEPRRFGAFFDRRKAEYDAAMLADRYGFAVDPRAVVASLGPAERREAEILRAMARGADVLILDEPTSILSEEEARALFALIGRLKAAGAGVVYISHRAKEILDLADRVSVLRNGRSVASVDAASLDECSLAELIIPTGACRADRRGETKPGEPVLELRGARLGPDLAVDLCVRSGEAVGVVALAGNYLDALEELASGLRPAAPGTALLLGRDLAAWPPHELYQKAMAYLPTERESRALSMRSAVEDSLLAKRLYSYTPLSYASKRRPRAEARALADGVALRGRLSGPVEALSGGNRQRLVLARELDGEPKLVLACNPAQGLDPGGRSLVMRRLAELRASGSAVLLLTQDPDDLAELADRSFALYRGRLAELKPESLNEGSLAGHLTGALR